MAEEDDGWEFKCTLPPATMRSLYIGFDVQSRAQYQIYSWKEAHDLDLVEDVEHLPVKDYISVELTGSYRHMRCICRVNFKTCLGKDKYLTLKKEYGVEIPPELEIFRFAMIQVGDRPFFTTDSKIMLSQMTGFLKGKTA